MGLSSEVIVPSTVFGRGFLGPHSGIVSLLVLWEAWDLSVLALSPAHHIVTSIHSSIPCWCFIGLRTLHRAWPWQSSLTCLGNAQRKVWMAHSLPKLQSWKGRCDQSQIVLCCHSVKTVWRQCKKIIVRCDLFSKCYFSRVEDSIL